MTEVSSSLKKADPQIMKKLILRGNIKLLIVDFFLVRKQQLALYKHNGT